MDATKVGDKKEKRPKAPRKTKKRGKSPKGEKHKTEVSRTKATIFLVVAFGMAVIFLLDIIRGGTVKGYFAAIFALVCGFLGIVYLRERKRPPAR